MFPTVGEATKSLLGSSPGAQSQLTLCDPMDCSPAGSSVHGIFQARQLAWVGISYSYIWILGWGQRPLLLGIQQGNVVSDEENNHSGHRSRFDRASWCPNNSLPPIGNTQTLSCENTRAHHCCLWLPRMWHIEVLCKLDCSRLGEIVKVIIHITQLHLLSINHSFHLSMPHDRLKTYEHW